MPCTYLFVLTQYKWDYFVTLILRDRTSSLTSGYDDLGGSSGASSLRLGGWEPVPQHPRANGRDAMGSHCTCCKLITRQVTQIQGRRQFLENGSSTTPGFETNTKHQPLPKNSSKSKTLKSSQTKQMRTQNFRNISLLQGQQSPQRSFKTNK